MACSRSRTPVLVSSTCRNVTCMRRGLAKIDALSCWDYNGTLENVDALCRNMLRYSSTCGVPEPFPVSDALVAIAAAVVPQAG